jgi:excisionase family DNA binding protein
MKIAANDVRPLVEQPPATIAEVAAFLKISRGSVYNLLNAGELVRIQLPGIRTTRIPWQAVYDLQRRSLVGPVDELVERLAEVPADAPVLSVLDNYDRTRRAAGQ